MKVEKSKIESTINYVESVESRSYFAPRKDRIFSIKIVHIFPDISIIIFHFGQFVNNLNSFEY